MTYTPCTPYTANTTNFRARVYALWLDKQDTFAISRELQVAEYDVERALHSAMALLRGTAKLRVAPV